MIKKMELFDSLVFVTSFHDRFEKEAKENLQSMSMAEKIEQHLICMVTMLCR